MKDKDSQPTTKALKPQSNSSPNSMPATPQETLEVLERLAIHYPRSDMNPQKWKLLFRSFLEILNGKTLTELRSGAHRYLRNAENKFFPTPGQLLDAMKNPFETHHARRYSELEPLPPPLSKHDAMKVIEETRAKYNFGQTDEPEILKREEILNRPPLVMTPELIEREKQMAPIRAAAIKRALELKSY